MKTTVSNLGPLFQGHRVCQQFLAEKDGLCGISLWIGTYNQKIDYTISLLLFDHKYDHEIRRVNLSTRSFEDNAWQHFGFHPLVESKSRSYGFCFESNGPEATPITLWTNDDNDITCKLNGELVEESICFKASYREPIWHVLDDIMFNSSAEPPSLSAQRKEYVSNIIAQAIGQSELPPV